MRSGFDPYEEYRKLIRPFPHVNEQMRDMLDFSSKMLHQHAEDPTLEQAKMHAGVTPPWLIDTIQSAESRLLAQAGLHGSVNWTAFDAAAEFSRTIRLNSVFDRARDAGQRSYPHAALLGSSDLLGVTQRDESPNLAWITGISSISKAYRSPSAALEAEMHLNPSVTSIADRAMREARSIEDRYLESLKEILVPMSSAHDRIAAHYNDALSGSRYQHASLLGAEIEQTIQAFAQSSLLTSALEQSVQSALAHASAKFGHATVYEAITDRMAAILSSTSGLQAPWGVMDSISALRAGLSEFPYRDLTGIDAASLATLTSLLGAGGLHSQLGAFYYEDQREQEDAHVARNAGISRGQFLLNLLTVLMAVWALYQGWATSQWQQEVTERLEKQRQTDQQVLYQLDQQRQLNDRMLKQLESLTEKVEKALLQEEKRERQRFVVRDRVATVRRSPEHGSPVQGALYPREMVQPLAESGKWVQFTYYHEWLQTYEVGWALKKYFDRVPAPQDRVDDEIDETGS